jgi:Glycosyltransferase family 25 (LPS biosynthesis protein)
MTEAMLYENDSPILPAYYSPEWKKTPKWPRSRHNLRTRAIIIIGLLALMLTTLLLLHHFSHVPTPQIDLHGLKPLKDLGTMPLSQKRKFAPLQRPPETQADYDDGSSLLPQVANATLDFGKIFVLNLETREDRHDEMALIGAATGLEFTYVGGVNSKALENQAMPDTYGTSNVILTPGHLACYRGHANIWRRIVEEGIETALILEDDVDWDLNIREIVPNVREGMTRITGAQHPFSNTPGNPFPPIYLTFTASLG